MGFGLPLGALREAAMTRICVISSAFSSTSAAASFMRKTGSSSFGLSP